MQKKRHVSPAACRGKEKVIQKKIMKMKNFLTEVLSHSSHTHTEDAEIVSDSVW